MDDNQKRSERPTQGINLFLSTSILQTTQT
jgi:hypothetical protein